MRSDIPAFGRRGRPRPPPPAHAPLRSAARRPDALLQDPAHAAVFAALRSEAAERGAENRPVAVPYSLRAALLAGTVVGCAQAGLDVAGIGRSLQPIADVLHLHGGGAFALPALLALGLLSGARAVATTLLLAHMALRRLGWTHPGAYALSGALAALVPTAVLALTTGAATAHGGAVDVAAGAAGGLLYRVFAGATRH